MSHAGMRKRWRSRSLSKVALPTPQPSSASASAKAQSSRPSPSPNASDASLSPLLLQLLTQRGLTDPADIRSFLEPKLTDLHDPALLPGLDAAAHRLVQAVREHQPIVVYGDYDVDGVCASSILWHVLRLAGADVTTYVPHRIDEGYGLNTQALCKLAGIPLDDPPSDSTELNPTPPQCDSNPTPIACGSDNDQATDPKPTPIRCGSASAPTPLRPLIISVDCGITALEPARILRAHGVDLIITDHHELNPDALPDAAVLVHPRLPLPPSQDPSIPPALPYPFPDLCGAGVAFKLAWHFARLWNGSDRVPSNYKALLLDLLSLAALGTVADIVPLVGENRIITTFGLGQIKRTQFTGLNALIDVSKLRDEKIDAYHVGFVLGPRLNACGRMGHAREAVQLLTTADVDQATTIAKFLCQQNDARRATEKAMFEEARTMVETCGYHDLSQRAIVLEKEGWHAGVVGIVASRLVDAFHRPVVMLTMKDGQAHGSARSVPGLSIHEAFTHCATHLSTFGGHAMAAGLRLDASHIQTFRAALVDFVNARLPADSLTAWLEIDARCTLNDITFALAQGVQKLAPFGAGNPSPLFCLQGVTLAGPVRRMGAGGKHLRLLLRGQGRHVEAVWFNAGDLEEQLAPGSNLEIVFRPVISTWQGHRKLEIHIEDARLV